MLLLMDPETESSVVVVVVGDEGVMLSLVI